MLTDQGQLKISLWTNRFPSQFEITVDIVGNSKSTILIKETGKLLDVSQSAQPLIQKLYALTEGNTDKIELKTALDALHEDLTRLIRPHVVNPITYLWAGIAIFGVFLGGISAFMIYHRIMNPDLLSIIKIAMGQWVFRLMVRHIGNTLSYLSHAPNRNLVLSRRLPFLGEMQCKSFL